MERITALDGTLIAIIVSADFGNEGITFVSEQSFPLQLGVSTYRGGVEIKPHSHIKKERLISEVQEVVHVDKGCAIVDFYDVEGNFVSSFELSMGATVLFVAGGHGFRLLEDCKLIEVKQGPYFGKENDKVMLNEGC